MPKMIEFSGEESKWLIFKRHVERYRLNCQYDDETVKTYMRGALRGEAYQIVRDILEDSPIDDIMEHLKRAFGDEMRMVRNRSEELRNLKFGPVLHKSEAVKLQVAIQSYFAACNYARIGYINTNIIAEAIFCQFTIEDRQRCREFYEKKNPGCTTIVMNVQTIYDYLMSRMPLLDEAPMKKKVENDNKVKNKPYQMNSTSLGWPQSNDSYKFEIKDKAKAPFIGYHMDKVESLSKECEICNSRDHFTLQCPKYKEKGENDRQRLVMDKRICKNCILTTSHRAIECDLKGNCGFKLDKASRCTGKHHITIHHAEINAKRFGQFKGSYKRRSNTRKNTSNANTRTKDAAENPPTPSAPPAETSASSSATFEANVPRDYNVQKVYCTLKSDSPKSVKVFRVKFWGPKGFIVALAIGDSGSEVTLLRDDLRQKLELLGKPHTLHLQWADKSQKTCDATQMDIQIQGMNPSCERFNLKNCFALADLNLPKRTLDMKRLREHFPKLKNIPFDGYYDEDPVMFIGSPHASLIEGCELVENGESGPIALNTKIGWTVYGGSYNMKSSEIALKQVSGIAVNSDDELDSDDDDYPNEEKVTNEMLNKMLVEYFSIESLGIKAIETYSTEDELKAVEILKEEIKILDNGTVEAPLVWNRVEKVIPKLPNNYHMVLKRQLATEKSLQKDPVRLKAFNDNVKELIQNGFLREATDRDMKGGWENIWYLPMSFFDASCVYKGESLNKKLLKGPDLLVKILQPLLSMRMNEIAFTADVKAMFNMIRICERDQQCQRILWRENLDEPIKTYIATVMLFGPTSSPFTSQYVKNTTAELWIDRYPDAARTLIERTYMDDVLTSEPSIEKALEVALQCIEIFKSINWDLVSFQSNNVELLKSLPPNAVKKDAIPLPGIDSGDPVTKVLGCFWNTKDDCFEFKLEQNLFVKMVKDFDIKPTKRDQASTLARIYDVLGLISFFTVRGKILWQRSWENGINWDQPVDNKSAKDWKNWLHQLTEIAKLKFTRRFTQIDALKNAEEVQLHIFCDAGTEAFGTVAYLVTKYDERIESNLVMAKAKVTPLRLKTGMKITEMPRLELLAAALAARICNSIVNILLDIKLTRHFWCDSEVVLRWITNPNQKLLKYAIGPVVEILKFTDRCEWKYVPTNLNVADLCTKMKKIDFSLDMDIWMHGPAFIRMSEIYWPKAPEKPTSDDYLMINNIYEKELMYSTHKLPPIDCPIASDDAIDRLSISIRCKWLKLRRAIARALKLHMDAFIPLVQTLQFSKVNKSKQLRKMGGDLNYLSADDLERAEQFIYRKIQRDEFPEEYAALKAGKLIKNAYMIALNVFMDPEGIIRINSRANLNRESFSQQFAPLLPRKNPYVTVLLAYHHYKFNHVATEAQIAEIRSLVWISQLKTEMTSIKKHCNWCNIKKAFPYRPKMSPLPIDRINPQLKPFEITGVDVLGPLRPTVNGNIKKIYILIFVCTLTRYVHLHLLDSLESLRVLEAIVMFWTAYGPVRKFISDNGTNFKRSAKTIREDEERAKFFARHQPEIGTKLAELYRTEWQFIAVHAPWFGGMYERLIKEVKRSLAGTLDRRKINRMELNIAVHEAAHRINCRPLTDNSLDAEDGEVLTPHHLAKNRSGWPILPGIHKNTYSVAPERLIYRRGRMIADEIMRKFTAYYLPILTKRSKWHTNETPAKVGDLVLVIEPNKTRKQWERARIIKIRLGRDGIARVADVRMFDGRIKKNRAVRNLAKLNLSTELSDTKGSEENKASTTATVSSIFEFDDDESDASKQSELIERTVNKSGLENKSLIMAHRDLENFILIEGIDSSMRLSTVIKELAPELTSIIAIYRIFDYQKKLNSESVILSLLDPEELSAAVAGRYEMNENSEFKVLFPDLISGTGYFRTNFRTIEEDRIAKDPKPLYVFDLPKIRLGTSEYLAKVVETIEDLAMVTGFKWNLGNKHNVTRNFGFAMLSDRDSVLRIAGQRLSIGIDSIRLDICNSTTVLINSAQKELLNHEGKAILSERLSAANWLNTEVIFKENDCREELKCLKVTIHNKQASQSTVSCNQMIQFTQSAPVMETRDDTIIINAETHELSDMEVEPEKISDSVTAKKVVHSSFDSQMPGTSASFDNSLREHVTVKAIAPKTVPIGVSRFIKMKMKGSYPFSSFNSRVMRFVTEYNDIVYMENDESATAFIEFKEAKTAVKFKKLMEKLDKDDQISIKYAEEKGSSVIGRVKSKKRRPKEITEIIYHINESKEMQRCELGGSFSAFSFPSPTL